MEKKRIVITGMGLVSCFGSDIDHFYKQLLLGKSGIIALTDPAVQDYSVRIGAPVQNFETGDYLDRKQARRVDRFISFAMVAGKKALENASLSKDALENLVKSRCGVIIGSGMGGMETFIDNAYTLRDKGYKRVNPFFIPYIISNMSGGLLAMDIGFMGPNYSISTACATANNSIISAANHIYSGECDLMVCGGSEASVIPLSVAGFIACGALSSRNDQPEKASRPWDKGRDGFVLGEGAGVIVLESLEHALKRGAPILAEYLGGGISCDAYHMTEPRADGEGVALCIRNALTNAGVTADDVNYINAHATSTPVGDMAEVNALKKVFKAPSHVVMNSTKSMIGHSLGAAGGLEAIATVKTITEKMAHPTINLEDKEEGLTFNVPTKAHPIEVKVALSNSFGFGGHNASLVFAPYIPK